MFNFTSIYVGHLASINLSTLINTDPPIYLVYLNVCKFIGGLLTKTYGVDIIL